MALPQRKRMVQHFAHKCVLSDTEAQGVEEHVYAAACNAAGEVSAVLYAAISAELFTLGALPCMELHAVIADEPLPAPPEEAEAYVPADADAILGEDKVQQHALRCKKCGGPATWLGKRTRARDEGDTAFFQCLDPDCTFVWK
jgi:DNA-directed RNA polymerase subunit M/transcription elongation factor TFIIS